MLMTLLVAVVVFAGNPPAGTAPASEPASRHSPTGRVLRVADQESLLAALKEAQGGETILVSPGSYEGFAFSRRFPDGRPLVIKSAQLHKAVFNRGRTLYFGGVENVVLDGFVLTGLQPDHRGAEGLIHVEGQSRAITLRNLHAHHAGYNDDCIKVNAAKDIDVIGCVLHDPGMREHKNGPQETLDYYDVDGGRIQGNLFTGGTSRQYINAKGGSRDIVIEDNILLNHHGAAGDEALHPGRGLRDGPRRLRGREHHRPQQPDRRLASGAFQVRSVQGAYIYNNLVFDCVGSPLIQVVPGNGPGLGGGSDGVYVFNNIFCNAAGKMPRLMRVQGRLENFQHGHNLYFNAGEPIPAAGYYDPNEESGAVFTDPKVAVAAQGDYQAVLDSLTILSTSPAIDAGAVLEAAPAGSPFDIRGTKRPHGKACDIGPLER